MKYRLFSVVFLITFLMIPSEYVYGADDYIILLDAEDLTKSEILVGELNPVTIRALSPRSLTTCFELESSGGGIFYTSSKVEIGAKIKSNIPKNENGISNRNFYYKQDTLGDVVLILKTFLRPENVSTSCDTWSPEDNNWQVYEKTISVVDSTSSDTADDTNNDNTASSTDSGTSGGSTSGGSSSGSSSGGSYSSGSSLSVHSSYVVASNDKPKVALEVSAGRDRLLNLGNALELHAKVTKGDTTGVRYLWSFGDGTSATGEKVSHSYGLPGTYNIVLNATTGSEEAVSRTTVKVVESPVIISEVNIPAGFLNLSNQSSVEVNLGGWQIHDGSETFTFPRDTIISANGKLPIVFSILNFTSTSTKTFVLQDGSSRVLAQVNENGGKILTAEQQAELESLNQELAVLMEQTKNIVVVTEEVQTGDDFISAPLLPVPADIIVSLPVGKPEEVTTSTATNTNQLANVSTIVIAKPESKASSFLTWPLNFIKQIFN
jgi:hypothetical protein